MTRRFWISLVLTVPLLLLSMAEMVPGLALAGLACRRAVLVWIQLALAAPVVLWGGWPFFERGWASVVSRNLNMFTLIALGPGRRSSSVRSRRSLPGIFPGFVPRPSRRGAGLLRAGRGDRHARPAGPGSRAAGTRQTGSAIRALLGLAPKTARRLGDDGARRMSRSIRSCRAIGLRIRPGEKVPVDGVVIEGLERRRRVDDHRRADPGRERTRRQA